ncbi:outer membrane beta-barrel protein [Candidatus Reidiella endopervernicosa]|uniref:outer membrane beta-barrel protein n=1 Tax=Candidatus Reidiella endopervernicosa TaxID=2738883 RepID=UPI001F26A387|nr:outer membrane beta-barrel protein [Candidatus Reidiella endopervernicosa]
MESTNRRCRVRLLIVLLMFAVPTMASGEEHSLEWSIGLSLLNFGYEEFDTDGRSLNREDGWLPGISASIIERDGAWFGEARASLYGGSVDYDGETQSGAPFTTETKTWLFDSNYRLGHWFGDAPRIAPYIGVGYHRWDRDIQGKGAVVGLSELYQWGYGGGGGW